MPIALIVEDEPEANKLLAMLLQLRGYRTESAFQGAEALEKIRDHAPDVVFLDLMLPDMDGYDVCRSLKSLGQDDPIPVVIVTARLTAENRIESFAVGADDYIPKPYTPDQIFEAIEQSAAWKDQVGLPPRSRARSPWTCGMTARPCAGWRSSAG
jgi:DNA-binding response OmpR family regulator